MAEWRDILSLRKGDKVVIDGKVQKVTQPTKRDKTHSHVVTMYTNGGPLKTTLPCKVRIAERGAPQK